MVKKDVNTQEFDKLVKAVSERINAKISFTVSEASQMTSISTRRIRKAIRRGELSALTDQTPWIVSRAELERWVTPQRKVD